MACIGKITRKIQLKKIILNCLEGREGDEIPVQVQIVGYLWYKTASSTWQQW
jgi:hypothetical protein